MSLAERYDSIVIGGGFYGSSIALAIAKQNKRVLLLEEQPELLQRASYNNQARVHGGYHYPRHFLTAVRSRLNLPRFAEEFRECIIDDFESYYAIARMFSKTTSGQFSHIMERAGAPLEVAPSAIRKLFSPELIDEVFAVREYAFDAVRMKTSITARLQEARVDVALSSRATHLVPDPLAVHWQQNNQNFSARAERVFNCTYSGLNQLLTSSQVAPVPLKHEITELCVVKMPEPLNEFSVTVMCGPFFSLMPFPSKGAHTLSHVRYTPHAGWTETAGKTFSAKDVLAKTPRHSHFPHMIRDAARYLPVIKDAQYLESLWEVKTLLPESETDDSRPILFKTIPQIPGLTCVIGGKIDNIYDVFKAME